MTGADQNRTARTCECGDHGFIGFKTWHVAFFDADKVPAVAPKRWKLSHPSKRDCYAYSAKSEMLHRVLAGVDTKSVSVDHIDGDTMNNRSANLRVCTHAQNMRNRRKHKGGTSAFKGVCKAQNGWAAEVSSGGVRIRKSGFATELEAALFYDAAAIHLHGEFARTNASLGLIPHGVNSAPVILAMQRIPGAVAELLEAA